MRAEREEGGQLADGRKRRPPEELHGHHPLEGGEIELLGQLVQVERADEELLVDVALPASKEQGISASGEILKLRFEGNASVEARRPGSQSRGREQSAREWNSAWLNTSGVTVTANDLRVKHYCPPFTRFSDGIEVSFPRANSIRLYPIFCEVPT